MKLKEFIIAIFIILFYFTIARGQWKIYTSLEVQDTLRVDTVKAEAQTKIIYLSPIRIDTLQSNALNKIYVLNPLYIDSIITKSLNKLFINKFSSDSGYFNKYIILQATSMADAGGATPGAMGILMLEDGTRQLRYYGKDYAGNTGWHTIPDSAMVRTLISALDSVRASNVATTSLDSNFVKITVDTITTNKSDSTVYIPKNLSVGYKTANNYDKGYISFGGMSQYGKTYGLGYVQGDPYHINLSHNIRGHLLLDNVFVRDDSMTTTGSVLFQLASQNRFNQGFGFYYNKSNYSAVNMRQIIFIATGDSTHIRGMAITSDTSNAGYPVKTLTVKGSLAIRDTIFRINSSGTIIDTLWWNQPTKDVWILPSDITVDSILVPNKDSIFATVKMRNYNTTNGIATLNYLEVSTNHTGFQNLSFDAVWQVPSDFNGFSDNDSGITVILNSPVATHDSVKIVLAYGNMYNDGSTGLNFTKGDSGANFEGGLNTYPLNYKMSTFVTPLPNITGKQFLTIRLIWKGQYTASDNFQIYGYRIRYVPK